MSHWSECAGCGDALHAGRCDPLGHALDEWLNDQEAVLEELREISDEAEGR